MIDADALEDAVFWLNGRLRSHGGAIALVSAGDDRVEVRFEGMCCGCPYKALTFNGTVRPALEAVPGVSRIEAAGTRISEEAAERLAAYVEGAASGVHYDRRRDQPTTP